LDERHFQNQVIDRMPSERLLPLAVLLLAIATPAPAQESEAEKDEAAAVLAVANWFAIVDAGDYGASWDAAAKALQGAVTRDDWAEAVASARAAFEPFGDRIQVASRHMTDPPNAPPGEYALMQYRTTVAGGLTVIETVVPMKEDGEWKVSGYFVREE
jgi:hypothetical protein